eukprot:1158519-Pelagomonas_calceolata.AAC.3
MSGFEPNVVGIQLEWLEEPHAKKSRETVLGIENTPHINEGKEGTQGWGTVYMDPHAHQMREEGMQAGHRQGTLVS